MDIGSWPDARQAPFVIDWARTAPAGDVAEYRHHLLTIAECMQRHLDRRAEALVRGLEVPQEG